MDALRRRFALRWLIAGSFVVLFIAIEAILGTGLYVQLRDYLWHSSVLRLSQQVVDAMRRTSPFPLRDEEGYHHYPTLLAPPDLALTAGDIVNEMAGRLTLARVIAPDGAIVAEGGFIRGNHRMLQLPPVEPARLNAVVQALQDPNRTTLANERPPYVYAYISHQGLDVWHVVIIPLTRGGQLVAFIQAAAPWAPAHELLDAFAGYLLLGAVLAAGLGVLVSFWLANLFTDPLRRLARTSRQVADGDLSARTGLGSGKNEVYQVARDFDHMVERVQDSFLAQRRFVADASHELKTPLTAIGGLAEVLRLGMDAGDVEKRQKAVTSIEREIGRMSRLVADLLTLSSTDQQPRAVDDVDVHRLVLEAADYGSLLAREHTFTVTENAGPVTVRGNHDHLTRVLHNLLDNAFKYTPPQGHIDLISRVENGMVVLAVKDDGIGIAAADLPHVFDRFYRADPSRNRKTGGTGLGLSIVAALVAAHQGTVDVQSQPGQGTLVQVRLPLASRTNLQALPAPGGL